MLRTVLLPVGTFAAGGLLGLLIGVVAASFGQEEASAPKTVEETVTETRYVTVTAPPDEAATATASASASAEASGAPIPDKDCSIGKLCDLGVGQVTITSAERTDTLTSEFMPAKSGNFVVVNAEYTYGGNAPASTDEIPWLLEDGEGRIFSYDFDSTNEYSDVDESFIYQEVQPGVTIPGKVIFAVPPDAKDFRLYIGDLVNVEGGDVAQVDL